MQELLTRDQYNQVQTLENPVASVPERHVHPSQRSKNVPKGKAESSKQMGKTPTDMKSGKRTLHTTWESVSTFYSSSLRLSRLHSQNFI